MNIRLIPRLDIKSENLVKGVNLEGIRVLGPPEAFARYYYEHGADELFYMDVVASLYERNSILEIVSSISRNIFIPMTVGGGLRSLSDIGDVLKSGADKVALNTAAVRDPQLVRRASELYGSSTIVVSIEAKRQKTGGWEAYIDSGREHTGLDAVEWAQQVTELGAGELIVTSVDQEGTGKGFDVDLVRAVAESCSVPVIAGGGAGSAEHVREVLQDGMADAVSFASLMHYPLLRDNEEFQSYPGARWAGGLGQFESVTLEEIKQGLRESGLETR
ncbi:imidazole glycerol phosphate synthase subunit HisF [Pseudodesulfovibrio senegalensis]|jgi:cyclase|uniref:imidazole glycerol-phosphate synthase n=1 Tax=Pseudodesulfovibrio senegalensis TaxID=1721087 RepID=A0A6N6N2N3_9BACT|nr:imidazole glycerol phosphate synthase cyclase subunit [Pseudodesulfovibrio senegalensis]KAB1441296.1 imidazole glycerol phosphate synthase subunit HisF [Pseudodesulfovibrio senegalensis]